MTDKEKLKKIQDIVNRAYDEEPSDEWDESVIYGKALDDISEMLDK